MANLKQHDDDDGELNDIKPEDKIGASDESDAESVDEDMEVSPEALGTDMWLVKIPKSLMEKWMQVKQPGVHLASMTVPNTVPGEKEHKITITLPDEAQYNTSGESKSYKYTIPTERESNTFVFAEQLQDDGPPAAKKPRITRFAGRVAHKGNATPSEVTEAWTAKVRERNREAHKKERGIILIDGDGVGFAKGQLAAAASGGIAIPAKNGVNFKALQSGTAKTKAKIALSQQKPVVNKSKEHRAREARNVVLDKLMELFSQQDAWSFKELQAATDQPADHLKALLGLVAIYHQTGSLHGKYTLNPTQKALLDSGRPPKEDFDDEAGPSDRRVKFEGDVKGEDGADAMDEEGVDDDEEMEDDFEEV
ncbi:hypothetical protein FRC01_000832 [Tulasnella sp. 417]|nr:hypothetical protein FRC01_000832 [Tulasnella sp. 417]